MTDVNLEANQVVGEEEEQAPKKKRGFSFLKNKVLLGAGAFLVLQAVVVVVVFKGLGDDSTEIAEAAPKEKGLPSLKNQLDARIIEIGDVSIWDHADPNPRADRRFTGSFTVVVAKDVYMLIEEALEENPDALNLVKEAIAREIRNCMLNMGGGVLKNKEMQRKFPERLKDYLNDRLPPLRNRILDVYMTNFKPGRY